MKVTCKVFLLLGTWQPDEIACCLHFLRRRAVGTPRAALVLCDAAALDELFAELFVD